MMDFNAAMPLFSIIIPTYNSELLLEKCLNSVITQSYLNKEIIVIDGGSTDKTLDIITQFKKKAPYIFCYSDKDKGIYDAMNIGIDKARGNWLYFLGSDDQLHGENILSDISSNILAHQRAKIFYGNVLTSDNYVQSYPNHHYKNLLELNICHQAIFYHHSLFENLRYDLKYRICADWDFNLKVFKQVNFPTYIDQTIASYNLQGASKNWREHPDYIHYFRNRKMVLRYRSFTYFFLISIQDRINQLARHLKYSTKWIFR